MYVIFGLHNLNNTVKDPIPLLISDKLAFTKIKQKKTKKNNRLDLDREVPYTDKIPRTNQS